MRPDRALVVFSLIVIFFWFGSLDKYVGLTLDEDQYYVTAKALAEGKGYRLISYPGEAPLQTRYPPGYPLVLGSLYKIVPPFPDHVIVMKAFSLFCVATSLFLWFLILRRILPEWLAALACILALSSLIAADIARVIASDPFFALIATAAIFFMQNYIEDTSEIRSRKTAIVVGILCAAAYLTRVAAVVLIAVVLLELIKRRDFWSVSLFSGSLIAFITPWFVFRVMSGMAGLLGYEEYLVGTLSRIGVGGYMTSLFSDTRSILFYELPRLLVSPVYHSFRVRALLNQWGLLSALSAVISAGAVALATAGLVVGWRDFPRFLKMYLLLTVGLVLLYPNWAFDSRYLLPVLPIVCAWLVIGMAWLCREWPNGGKLTVAFICISACLGLTTSIRRFVDIRTLGFDRANREVTENFGRMSAWLREHSRSGDIVISENPQATYIWTGLKGLGLYNDEALPPPGGEPPASLLALPPEHLKLARFLISNSRWPRLTAEEVARMKGVAGLPVASFGPFKLYDLRGHE